MSPWVVYLLPSVYSPGASLIFTIERLQYFNDGEVTHLSVAGFRGLPRCYGDGDRLKFLSSSIRNGGVLNILPAPCHVSDVRVARPFRYHSSALPWL